MKDITIQERGMRTTEVDTRIRDLQARHDVEEMGTKIVIMSDTALQAMTAAAEAIARLLNERELRVVEYQAERL